MAQISVVCADIISAAITIFVVVRENRGNVYAQLVWMLHRSIPLGRQRFI